MDEIKIVELKESILEDNNKDADLLRTQLRKKGIFLINLMSAPGSGKTTMLVNLKKLLENGINLSVLEADIDSDTDAKTMLENGINAVQLHTGGMCHLDADMTRQGINALEEYCKNKNEKYSKTANLVQNTIKNNSNSVKNSKFSINSKNDVSGIVVLENIGNLVCPAEYDTGAFKNVAILSVPEGDDKPVKYPLMFSVVDLVLISKIDTLEYFDFDIKKCEEQIHKLNKNAKVILISSVTGEGYEELAKTIANYYKDWVGSNGKS